MTDVGRGYPKMEAASRGRLYRMTTWLVRGGHERLAPGSLVELDDEEGARMTAEGSAEALDERGEPRCAKCGAEPCSPECFAKAGYDPAGFDTFVANLRSVGAPATPAIDGEPTPTAAPIVDDAGPSAEAAQTSAPPAKRGPRKVGLPDV